jgi:hypothetical protein
MMVTNESATDLFSPHWQPRGDALAFTINNLEARFYNPICIWSPADPEVHLLDVEYFRPLLGSRYPKWGTTTEFVAWEKNKVLVRVYNCDYPDDVQHPPDSGMIFSYDIITKKISLVH